MIASYHYLQIIVALSQFSYLGDSRCSALLFVLEAIIVGAPLEPKGEVTGLHDWETKYEITQARLNLEAQMASSKISLPTSCFL